MEAQCLRTFTFVGRGVSWFGYVSRATSADVLQRTCFRFNCKVTLFLFQDLILPNGGTPAGTSSPASSSSLLNRLQLDDDIDGETRDLFVTVDDPKKHVCTMETYITYRITTKVGPFIIFCPRGVVWVSWRPTIMMPASLSPSLCRTLFTFLPMVGVAFWENGCFQIKRILCEFFTLKWRRNCDYSPSNKTFIFF